MSNPYNLSDETLDALRENNPELWREMTRPAPTLPYWQAPQYIDRRTLYQVVVALFQQPVDGDDPDIIEGEYR